VADAQRGVTDALREQREQAQDSARSIADAQRTLAEAMRSADEAIGGAAGGVDAVAAAMDGLSPAGQRFARFLDSKVLPAIKRVKFAAQEAFLPPLEAALDRLLVLEPNLTRAVTNMGEAFGDLAIKGARLVTSGPFRRDFDKIMDSNVRAFRNASPGILSLVDALKTLAVTGGPVLERIGTAFSRIAGRFADFLDRQRKIGEADPRKGLAGFFTRAYDAAKQLIGIVGNVIAIIYNIGKAAAGSGRGLLTSFQEATAKLREFTGSAEGQNKIRDYFERVAEVTRTVFTLLTNLTGAFGRLVGALLPFASAVAEVLANNPALAKLAATIAVMVAFAGPLKAVAGAVATLLPLLARAVVAITGMTGAAAGATGVLAVLATPAGAVAAAVLALAAAAVVLYAKFEPFRRVVNAVASGFKDGLMVALSPVIVAYRRVLAPAIDRVRDAFRDNADSLASLGRVLGVVGGFLAGQVFGRPLAIATVALGVLADVFAVVLRVVGPIAGALGSLGGAIGRLIPGFGDLGRSGKQASEDVKRAEDELRTAQEKAKTAQDRLNDARRTAIERLRDMKGDLKDAALAEEGAVIALQRARERLNEVNKDPKATKLDRAEALLGYKQAVRSLEEQKERTQEAKAEARRLHEEGVAGNKDVQAASKEAEDAQIALREAEAKAAEARTGAAQESVQQAEEVPIAASDAMTRAGAATREFLVREGSRFGGWVKEQGGKLGGFFAGLPEQIGGKLGPLRDRLQTEASEAWEGFRTRTATKTAQLAADAKALPGRIGGALSGLKNAVIEKASNAWGAFNAKTDGKAGELIKKVRGLPRRASDALSDLKDKVTDRASRAWESFRQKTGLKGDDTIKGVKGLPGRANAALSDLKSKVETRAKAAWESFKAQTGLKGDSTIGIVKGLPGRASSALSALSGNMRQRAQDGFDRLRQGASDKVGAARDVVAGLPGRARDALRNIGGSLLSSGGDLIGGFIRGIRDRASDIIWAIRDTITDRLPGYVKKALGIASPSRVFAAIGGQVVAGMVQGLDQPDVVQDAAERLAEAVESISPTVTVQAELGEVDTGSLQEQMSVGVSAVAAPVRGAVTGDPLADLRSEVNALDPARVQDEQARRAAAAQARVDAARLALAQRAAATIAAVQQMRVQNAAAQLKRARAEAAREAAGRRGMSGRRGMRDTTLDEVARLRAVRAAAARALLVNKELQARLVAAQAQERATALFDPGAAVASTAASAPTAVPVVAATSKTVNVNTTVNNPVPETASESVNARMRRLSELGVM